MHKRETSAIVLAMILILGVIVVFAWQKATVEPDVLDVPKTESANESVPNFASIENTNEKKAAFFSYLKPEIAKQNEYLLTLRHYVQKLQRDVSDHGALSEKDNERVEWLCDEYRVDTEQSIANKLVDLLDKIDIIPVELVLVQAANESAWGTSRFAQEGYNFFGLWCYRKGCGFVPSHRNTGAKHEVAKFSDASKATYTYMRNLNRHAAYSQLRAIRASLRKNQLPISGHALAEGLINYSERGAAYVEELQSMMRYNQEYLK